MVKKSPINKYTLKDGSTRYQFQIHAGRDPMSGKRRVTRRRGFKTRDQAKIEYNRLKAKVDRDGTIKKVIPPKNQKRFSDVYKEWLVIYKQQVQPISYQHIKHAADNQIIPRFGDQIITKITGADLQKFVSELNKKYKSISRFITPLKSTFHYAYKMGYTKSNEFLKVDLPRKKKSKIKIDDDVLTKDQLDKYLLFIKLEDTIEQYSFFYLLSHTGMRRSEALALKWSDIRGKKLRIQRTITKGYNGKFILGKNTKTNSSNRTIVLDTETLKILNQWHLSLNNHLARLDHVNHLDLVFPSYRHGEMLVHNPNWANKVLRSLQHKFPQLKKIDVHGFRHTWATLALDAGLSIRDVQKQLGHASYATTMNIYAKYTHEQQQLATEKMEQFWNQSGSQKQ